MKAVQRVRDSMSAALEKGRYRDIKRGKRRFAIDGEHREEEDTTRREGVFTTESHNSLSTSLREESSPHRSLVYHKTGRYRGSIRRVCWRRHGTILVESGKIWGRLSERREKGRAVENQAGYNVRPRTRRRSSGRQGGVPKRRRGNRGRKGSPRHLKRTEEDIPPEARRDLEPLRGSAAHDLWEK